MGYNNVLINLSSDDGGDTLLVNTDQVRAVSAEGADIADAIEFCIAHNGVIGAHFENDHMQVIHGELFEEGYVLNNFVHENNLDLRTGGPYCVEHEVSGNTAI